jgi:rhodanese-related sulfurtransferase
MISQRVAFVPSTFAAAWLVALAAGAAEWGTIKGKFVYEGKPKVEPVTITQDVAFCSEHKPVDERVVVGKDGGLQNVFVYLEVDRGKEVPVHEDYASEEGKVVVLDVRTADEYNGGHIAGAKNIDFTENDFAEKAGKLDKSKPYLVHCASGRRSTASLEVLQKLGFKSIYHLDGGFKGWEKAGKPVEK